MRSLLLCLLALITAISGVHAQDNKSTAAPPYRIAAGDVLEVTVQDHTDLSKVISVLPDGTISYPYVGELNVTGLTLKELTARLSAGLGKQIATPIILITIQKMHEVITNQVVALGAIKTPGKHQIRDGYRILDLVIDSGGLSFPLETESAAIIRNGVENIKVDLQKVMSATDLKANLELKANDIIMFTAVEPPKQEAQVLGEVNRPGTVPVTRDGGLTGILNAVGGLTARAALSQAQLTHNGKTKQVDLHTLNTEGRIPADFVVAPGDTLFIPKNKTEFSVYGSVGHPGVQIYPEDKPLTVISALSIAGGLSADANLKNVLLVHPTATGKSKVDVVNMDLLLKKGDLSKDLPLKPGDILYVSAKVPRRVGEGILDYLSFVPLFNLFHIPL